jgi:lauroyl/myristoyl acyltransferase
VDLPLGVALLTLRAVGVVLPAPLLWLLLWPIAWVRSVWELVRGRPTVGEFRKLSGAPFLSPGSGLTFGRLLFGRTRLNLAKFLFLWPEKLASERGRHWRVVGADRLEALRSCGRPAVLVTLHYGPMGVLFNWLRARGYPVCIVAAKGRRKRPWYRRYLARLRDTRGGLESLPSLIEVGQVLEMRDHLAANGLLMVAVDGGYGRHSCVPAARGLALSMSTGALQLAALTGALVAPCLIRSGPLLSATISLGEPLAAESVADKSRHAAACDHLLRAFLPVLAEAPEECSFELLASLRRVDSAEESIAIPLRRAE